jgi:NitT/TauT family transport system ATP-binding protein
MSYLEAKNIKIIYRKSPDDPCLVAVENLNLSVNKGEFVTIVGPSGCGKSTFLMSVDGLIRPDQGEVYIGGKKISSPGPERAVVFQEFALLPWRTVESNVAFGLEFRDVPPNEKKQTIDKYVKMVGLAGFEKHYPHQLSGGMRQRAGLARALSVNPEILLMDEPFAAIDAQTREIMGTELLRIWDREKKTVLFVTHSIDESIYLADRIVIMTARPGRVKEIIDVKLPRPRRFEVKSSMEFVEYRKRVWQTLEEEVKKVMDYGTGESG